MKIRHLPVFALLILMLTSCTGSDFNQTIDGDTSPDGDTSDGDDPDGDDPDGDDPDGDDPDGDDPDGDDPDGDDPDGDTDGDVDEDLEEEISPPRRGSADDLPDAEVTCEEGCNKLADCGWFNLPWQAITDVDDCIMRCESADQLPYSGPSQSDDNFRRCTSVEDDCDAIRYCADWLYDPRLDFTCEVICICAEGMLRQGPVADELTELAPAGLTLAEDTWVVERRQSLDFANLATRYQAPLTVEGSGRFIRLQAQGAIDQALVQQLYRELEPLPTFKDEAGRIWATSDRLIVTPRQKNTTTATQHLTDLGLGSIKPLHWTQGRMLATAASPLTALRLAKQLNNSGTAKAEIDWIRFYSHRAVADDPLFPQQWHLKAEGQGGTTPFNGSRVWEAWDITKGSSNIVVGINDDGCDINHPDLAANMETTVNFPANWQNLLGSGFGSHGTMVAGVAAAVGDNTTGVAGVCPGCHIRCSWALDDTQGYSQSSPIGLPDSMVAERFVNHADAGTAVVNNSWGPDGGEPERWGDTPNLPSLGSVVTDSFDYAETNGRGGKGMLIVFAAGNSNQDVSQDEFASYPTNIAVAGVDEKGLKVYYSTFGEQILVAAPTWGGISELGIVTTALGSESGEAAYSNHFNGTSASAPFVTGVIGLILSANPDLTATQVRDILAQSARKIDRLNGQYDEQGHSPYYGYGMVDAYVAVRMAQNPVECGTRAACLGATDSCGTERGGACERGACDECADNSQCASGICQAVPALGRHVCLTPCEQSSVEPDGDIDDEGETELPTDGDQEDAETRVDGDEEISGEEENESEIETEPVESCEENFTCVNHYCVPTRAACDLCDAQETCNGVDDDCDGVVDGPGVCPNDGQYCHEDSDCADLEDGTPRHCLAHRCMTECTSHDECGTMGIYDLRCLTPSYRYGAVHPGHKVCLPDGLAIACDSICGLMLSDSSDENMADLETCIEDQVEGRYVDCMGVFNSCMGLMGK